MRRELEPNQLEVRFYECEHSDDLGEYEADLAKAGARVIRSTMNEEAEDAVVLFEVDDKADFKRRFVETDAFEFSTLWDVWRDER